MPIFDGKSENFDMINDLSQASLNIHNQLYEDDRFNFFHPLMRGDAFRTFKNIRGQTLENLVEMPAIFLRENVLPQPLATA